MSPNITRRQFLAGTLATGATLLSPSLLADTTRHIRSLTDRVKLGRSGIDVSYLGFGTGTIGWNGKSNQTKLGTVGFARLIRYALDRGVNYFDCADQYGSHPYLRAALKGIPRESYVIQTKIWPHADEDFEKTLDRFRRELNTDCIDVLFIHCVTDPDWATAFRRMTDFLEEAKQKKRIRAHGISIHNLDVMKSAVTDPWVDLAFCRINPVGEKMDAAPSEVVPILRKLHDAGKGVAAMKILGEGAIADRREESLRYVLKLDCVDAMVIGFESTGQVDDILKLGNAILGASNVL